MTGVRVIVKGIVAYIKLGHMHVCDDYYTKLYIIGHLIK